MKFCDKKFSEMLRLLRAIFERTLKIIFLIKLKIKMFQIVEPAVATPEPSEPSSSEKAVVENGSSSAAAGNSASKPEVSAVEVVTVEDDDDIAIIE